MGPPKVPPYCGSFELGFARPARLAKKSFAFKIPLRWNSKRPPCQVFEPDLVTRLMTPPPKRPYSAESAFVCTLNSCTEPTIGVYADKLLPTLFSGRMLLTPSSCCSFTAFREPQCEEWTHLRRHLLREL